MNNRPSHDEIDFTANELRGLVSMLSNNQFIREQIHHVAVIAGLKDGRIYVVHTFGNSAAKLKSLIGDTYVCLKEESSQ